MAFLEGENKNWQPEDLPVADFGRVPGKEKLIHREFCELKVMPIVCFCNDTTHFFILSLIADSRQRALRLFARIVEPMFFIY